MNSKAVIGAAFGDEGKGKVVSYLCSLSPDALVVRFSGGQQAGHKVMLPGIEHVFSNFGSGTLQGNPTYWSRFCTVDPVGILNELSVLSDKGVWPTLYIDQACPVTTPYEKKANARDNSANKHGSCCVGVGRTIQREHDHYSITAYDLQYPWILKEKLRLLRQYYLDQGIVGIDTDEFLTDCHLLLTSSCMEIVQELDPMKQLLIFEGSQGLLLDQNFGFFPHVTRSNTGTKNVLSMCQEPEIFIVTRSYQTRHGNGPMSNEEIQLRINNPYEYNSSNSPQGIFRTSPLDLTLLEYAINRDDYIRQSEKTLVVTCIDAVEEFILTMHGKVYTFKTENSFLVAIKQWLGIDRVLISRSPISTYMEALEE